MTFVGFDIRNGEAWAWADAESYGEDTLTPSRCDTRKMGFSASGFVVVGTGDGSITEEVRSLVEEFGASTSLANAMHEIREAARYIANLKRVRREARGEKPHDRTSFGVVGLESGRLRGFKLRQADDFRPTETDAWASPGTGDHARNANDVLRIALAQLEILKREIPRATGRALTIAKIGPLGVATTIVRF